MSDTPTIWSALAAAAELSWWIRGLIGAGIGAALTIVIPSSYTWFLNTSQPNEIAIVCSATVMPRTIPEGGLRTVMLYPGGGGSMISTDEPGRPTNWAEGQPAFKCEVKNLSGKELPALLISLPIQYRQHDGSPIEESKRHSRISIIAPFLDVRAEKPFTFFVRESNEFGAEIAKVEVEYFRPDQSNRAIKIKTNLVYPIAFGMAPK